MGFEAAINEHTVRMDTKPSAGGSYSAPTPKELVLTGLCGCTGMDVVWILNKMRLKLGGLAVDAEASQSEGEPSVFDRIKLIYKFSGENLPADKVKQAVELSQTKYCGVSAMIAKTARIDYEILLNDASVGSGTARFAVSGD